MSIKNFLKAVVFSLLTGIALVWLAKGFFQKPNCYDFKQSATILQSLKQDPLWRGIVTEEGQEKMIAVFGNSRTGSWNRVIVDADGSVCFVETGTDFQNMEKNIINL